MKKKILVFGILTVFTLVTISFTSAVSSNITTTATKKESPIFRIRTKQAIGERLQNLRDNIKAKFLGDRIFFIPFLMKNIKNGNEVEVLWSAPGGTFGCCTVNGAPTSIMCCK